MVATQKGGSMNMMMNLKRFLRLNFAERAMHTVNAKNSTLKRDVAARLSRGSVARQNRAVLSLEEMETQKNELRGVKLAG